MATGAEWLGLEHPAVQCLRLGIALHHAGLPRPYLNEVEHLLRTGDCRITIASPTLAQGLNLSASVLLVPSIWRKQEVIPAAEFANVAGRAGRAFVDLEGLVLHVVRESDQGKAKWAVSKWEELLLKAKSPRVASGILLLAETIHNRISNATGIPIDEVVEYVAGHADAWDLDDSGASRTGISIEEWDRGIASLDAALLALLNANTAEDCLSEALTDALEGSLFSRQLAEQEERVQKLIRGFIAARAKQIWSQTVEPQRRGYHTAGIGLKAGQFLDNKLGELVGLIAQAEMGITEKDADNSGDALVAFAERVFQIAPFRAPGELPAGWQEALRGWIIGWPAADVIGHCDDGVDLLQEALTYRLPWALEAVRVHAVAVGHDGAGELNGMAALAVESGSIDRAVITLLRNGLGSREAAHVAVNTTEGRFENRLGMLVWLRSRRVRDKSVEPTWPTTNSRHAWLQFVEAIDKHDYRAWMRSEQRVVVEWNERPPPPGAHVSVEPIQGKEAYWVLSPAFQRLGRTTSALDRPHSDIVEARVTRNTTTIRIEYFGPQPLLRKQ